jgi:hypothetical protein
MSAADGPDTAKDRQTSIGGYRVIRALGSGSRATVWLGHTSLSSGPPSVALKVFSAHDEASVAIELAAYERTQSPHVARLIDVCSGTDSAVCFVLEWLGEGSLAVFVRQRRRVRTGEAVTVLVSVLRGIRDLHAAGFAHNGVTPTNVLFDGTGRPVLISLGHATPLSGSYAESAMQARGPDWAQFLGIVDLVVSRVEVDGREAELAAVHGALARLATSIDEQEACNRVEDALYAFAQPAPLVLHPRTTPGSAHRSQTGERHVVHRPVNRRTDIVARTEAVLDAGPIRSLRAAIAPAVRRKRRQLIFGGVLACVVGVAGLAAIPPEPGDSAEHGSAHHGSAQRSRAPLTRAQASSTPRAMQKPADAVTQDEPVAAVVALMAARERCLAMRSVDCLTLTDQDASPLFQTDSAAVRAGGVAGRRGAQSASTPSSSGASLIERTGDSALVELPRAQLPNETDASQPVSVLAIKGEHGWRLREIFSA